MIENGEKQAGFKENSNSKETAANNWKERVEIFQIHNMVIQ